MVIDPEQAQTARMIFEKWDLDFMPIGKVTDSGRLVLLKDGQTACDIPLDPLVEDAPEYDRPVEPVTPRPAQAAGDLARPAPAGEILLEMLASPDLCSRRWIWEQYDSHVMADTIAGSGGDAALVRVHRTEKALAMTTDCTPRYVEADPVTGGMQAVAEAWRNITATGATPLAVTNNLNFGNPEKPEIMAQLAGAVQGMGAACEAFGTPVVSGNVSLYNETDGKAIRPAPVIGMVGLIENWQQAAGIAAVAPGQTLILLGASGDDTGGWLSCSSYARLISQDEAGAPPPVDLAAEKAVGDFLRRQILDGQVTAAHDISDGGLLVAAAEMVMAGTAGLAIDKGDSPIDHGWAFGEDQARYLLLTTQADQLTAAAEAAGLTATPIGQSIAEQALKLSGEAPISRAELSSRHEATLPQIMTG